jgi:DNA-binding SARP family transcriptional activator/tetratricopeptide (TPR) repeat protein
VARSLSYGLLGPLEVRNGTTLVPIRPGKVRVLLASLLLSANRPVPHEVLAEWLWGDKLPYDPRATLATYVMRLRHALGAGEPTIHTGPTGYLIRATPEQLDVLRFTELVTAARRADTPEDELRLLTEALAQWRGPALTDVGSEALRRGFAVELEERRLQTIERRTDVALALGRHTELVAGLTSHVVEHPLRERFWTQLMLALYRSGRQAEALDAYSRLRTLLIDELGLEPTEEVRRLHQQILAADPALDPPSDHPIEIDSEPRPSPRWEALSQLPPDTDDFVGRDAVIEMIGGRLGSAGATTSVPIVVISGAPGTGKTTLAVRIAHQLRTTFPDGQLFTRLGGAQRSPRDPADVLADLLNASGISPSALPDGLERRSNAFRARLTDRRVLLVLDDAADAEQVIPLLPGTPGCAVLITSRKVIPELPGAADVRLPAFTPDEAITFLTHMLGPDRVAREPESVSTLARQCADLPLALRIVGARLVLRPTAHIARLADRLADSRRRLDELEIGTLNVRAGLAASYDALTPEAAVAFRRLGLLPRTTVAVWTIGMLAESSNDAHVTEQLLQANLISEVGLDLTDEPRYRLHDLVADYAGELVRGEDADAIDAALRRLIDTFIVVSDVAYSSRDTTFDNPRADPVQVGADVPHDAARLGRLGSGWLAAEQDTILWTIWTCIERGWHRDAAMIADRTMEGLRVRLPAERIQTIFAAIRDTARRAGDERLEWRAEFLRLTEIADSGFTDEAVAAWEATARAFARMGTQSELSHTLTNLAWIQRQRGDIIASAASAERAVRVAEQAEDARARLTALRELASSRALQGRDVEARDLLDDALATAREFRSRGAEAAVLERISHVAVAAGDLERAQRAADRFVEISRHHEDLYLYVFALARASAVAAARAEGDRAVELAEEAVRATERSYDQLGLAIATAALAESYLAADRPLDAGETAAAALEQFAGLGAVDIERRLRAVLDKTMPDARTP